MHVAARDKKLEDILELVWVESGDWIAIMVQNRVIVATSRVTPRLILVTSNNGNKSIVFER